VTDHDTIDGALAMEALLPAGISYIRGVEFSCVSPGGKCHILGYGYDPAHPVFRAALQEGSQLRREKLENRIIHLREKFGIRLTEEELRWLRSLKSPGKPHLGRILADRGLAPDLSTAIKTYLNLPNEGSDRIPASLAIRAIAHAGGIPIWAHPLGGEGERQLSKEKFHAQLETLLSAGLQGLECFYSRYGKPEADFLMEQADRRGLLISGGSDYHGANKADLHLGKLSAEDSPVDPGRLTVCSRFPL
jgi:predicted metal-dependent phosphoesterase TrpH